MADRPNFLILLTDQQRADQLGCMGNPGIRTPNIDRLAREGIAFDNAYVNNPVCMPSRATLFTGRTARGHGVRSNGIALDTRVPTITQALREAGYRTYNAGKIHLQNYGVPRGIPPGSLDPSTHVETRALWIADRIDRVHPGYYGLDEAEITIGHGAVVAGDYLNWIRREHPEAERFLARDYSDNRPDVYLEPPSGADQSFKWAMPPELHHSTWVADRTIAYIRTHAADSQPFFAFCSFPDPHHPWCPPAPWCSTYDPRDIVPPRARREGELDSMPWHYRAMYEKGMWVGGRRDATKMDDKHLREIIAHSYGQVSLIDHNVGRVLDELDRLGIAKNTVVMFLSDHGELMGDHWLINKGPFLYRGLTRVPLLLRWPERVHGGRRIASLVSLLDFAPTVLDIAGVPIPEGEVSPQPEAPRQMAPWPGYSLLPLVTGASGSVRDRCLVEYDEDYLGYRLRSLVTPEFRITMYGGQQFGELFDLRNDPDELYNLWDDPSGAPLKRRGLETLLDEVVETDCALPRRLTHA